MSKQIDPVITVFCQGQWSGECAVELVLSLAVVTDPVSAQSLAQDATMTCWTERDGDYRRVVAHKRDASAARATGAACNALARLVGARALDGVDAALDIVHAEYERGDEDWQDHLRRVEAHYRARYASVQDPPAPP